MTTDEADVPKTFGIEHNNYVDKVRAMIRETRAAMSERDRGFKKLVYKAVHARHAPEIAANHEMARALLTVAILHLCEEAESDEMRLGADLLTRMTRMLDVERNLLLLDMRDLLESLSIEHLGELAAKDDEAIAAYLRQVIELDHEPDQSCPRYHSGSGYSS